MAEIDERRIKHAIHNLVVSAIGYADDTPVTITLAAIRTDVIRRVRDHRVDMT